MDIQSYMVGVGKQARAASRLVARADTATKNKALTLTAQAIGRDVRRLLDANAKDLDAARNAKLDAPLIDRLTLTEKTIAGMADGLQQIAKLPDPIGEISELKQQPSGIKVGRMRVPLGVVAIIYESRPNVTADAAGLCLKAGNAAILRGGSEAIHSNQAIAACVHEGLTAAGLPATAVQVIETTDRAAVGELLHMNEYVDILVPRGGKGLIERVEALTITELESTSRRKRCARASSSVTMASVCAEPYLAMWSIAWSMSFTTRTVRIGARYSAYQSSSLAGLIAGTSFRAAWSPRNSTPLSK